MKKGRIKKLSDFIKSPTKNNTNSNNQFLSETEYKITFQQDYINLLIYEKLLPTIL